MGAPQRRVVILGPESSGGRFVHRWLDSHPDIDAEHWSMPHGPPGERRWPTNTGEITPRVDLLVVTQRMAEPMIASQMEYHPVDEHEAAQNVSTTYLLVHRWAAREHTIPEFVSYEALVTYGERAMARVWQRLNLDPVPCPERIIDGNEKWLR